MNFGFLVFPDFEELDLIGPWEMIGYWSQIAKGPDDRFLVAEGTDPVSGNKGLSINPQVNFRECPPLDYLLVPGGWGTRKEVDNENLIHFVSEQARGCQAILSVCTGSFILHRAGLLSGKRATTHWASLGRLRDLGDVQVVEERIVRDGRVWTSAGVSAGIDLALAFIAQTAGEEAAGRIQFASEYFPLNKNYGQFYRDEKAPLYVKKL